KTRRQSSAHHNVSNEEKINPPADGIVDLETHPFRIAEAQSLVGELPRQFFALRKVARHALGRAHRFDRKDVRGALHKTPAGILQRLVDAVESLSMRLSKNSSVAINTPM